MAPNKRGGSMSKKKKEELSSGTPLTRAYDPADCHEDTSGGVISKAEVEARGSGTNETSDSYDAKNRWFCEKRVFFTGLMFLTRLPCPGWCDHHPAFLMRSIQWFPLIGMLIGGWCAVWLNAATVLYPLTPILPAAISTMAGVWLTGCFHEDGLADCFDGFGGGWGRKQILRIMKDSRIGTYALVGMSLCIIMKLCAIAHLLAAGTGLEAWVVVIVAHTTARWTCLPLIYCCHYLQDDEDAKRGLYNWMAQSQRLLTPIRLFVGTATMILVPYFLLPLEKAYIVYATVVSTSVLAGYYGNLILGGVMGDYLGATIQVTELLVYLALTANLNVAHLAEHWQPLVTLGVVASLPLLYSRPIIDNFSGIDC